MRLEKRYDDSMKATVRFLSQRVGERKAGFCVVSPDVDERWMVAIQVSNARRQLREFISRETASS